MHIVHSKRKTAPTKTRLRKKNRRQRQTLLARTSTSLLQLLTSSGAKKIYSTIVGVGVFAVGLFFVLSPKTIFPTKEEHSKVVRTITPEPPSSFGPIKISDKLLTKENIQAEAPLRIVVPSVSIDLPVIESQVVNGYWELSETTASHGVGSGNPGHIGNTVIFAHARAGLFAPLRGIKKSQLIYVLTKERWYRYQVDQIKEVKETQTEVVAPTTTETLTLFTCSGFLDSKRLIVTAKAFYP